MMGVRTPSGAPALVATLPPRRLPKSVHFSMATSVHFSVAIDNMEGPSLWRARDVGAHEWGGQGGVLDDLM